MLTSILIKKQLSEVKDVLEGHNMPSQIINLYIYFLYYGTKKSREAFDRFYDADNSRSWVRRYAVLGNRFYSEFMSKYSKEVREREMNQKPFNGVITPRGVLKC